MIQDPKERLIYLKNILTEQKESIAVNTKLVQKHLEKVKQSSILAEHYSKEISTLEKKLNT